MPLVKVTKSKKQKKPAEVTPVPEVGIGEDLVVPKPTLALEGSEGEKKSGLLELSRRQSEEQPPRYDELSVQGAPPRKFFLWRR